LVLSRCTHRRLEPTLELRTIEARFAVLHVGEQRLLGCCVELFVEEVEEALERAVAVERALWFR
jgi:hypothetical protein